MLADVVAFVAAFAIGIIAGWFMSALLLGAKVTDLYAENDFLRFENEALKDRLS